METTLFLRMILLLFSILALSSTTKGQGFGNVGLMASVTQKAIDGINKVVLDDVSNQLEGKRFSDVSGSSGDVSYKFYDVSVSGISGLTSSVSLSDGSGSLDWNADISSISATSSWSATWKVAQIFGQSLTASADGRITATANNVHLGMSVSFGALSGALYIDPMSSSSQIGGLDIHFHGGDSVIDWALNLLKDLFQDKLRKNLQDEICQAADGAISRAASDLKNINTTTTIHILGASMTLDLGFVSVQIRKSKFSTYHMGMIKYGNTTYQLSTASSIFPAISDSMLSLYMREEMLYNFVKALSDQNLLDGSFSVENVDPKYKAMLAFDCQNQYCIGMLIPKLNQFYPGSNIKMRTRSVVAALNFKPNSLIVKISGRLELLAAKPNFADTLICSGDIDLEVPLQVRFQETKFVVRFSNLWGNLTIDTSNIGHILDRETQTILNSIISLGKGMITDQLNKYETAIPIKLPKDVTFSSASVKVQSGIIGLEADICYKEACSFTGSQEWVGDSFTTTQRMISVLDVTPLDTTPSPGNKPVVDGKGSGACDIKTLSVNIALRVMMLIVFVYLLL